MTADHEWSTYRGYSILTSRDYFRVYFPDASTRTFPSMRRARLAIKRDWRKNHK